MEKRFLVLVLVLGALALPLLYGSNTLGSDGAQLSGGGCGQKAAPEPDSDQDGVADALDNCPTSFNPSQTDSDGNGIGEICEAVEPFDGLIECPFPTCGNTDECFDFLQNSCPEDAIEIGFLGDSVSCCDQVCVVVENPEEGACPAGSCPFPFLQCSSDQECQDAGSDFCLDGCCLDNAECEPCGCEPDDPNCVCPPCGNCPDAACDSQEDCPEGASCDSNCCVPDVSPPPPPPPPGP